MVFFIYGVEQALYAYGVMEYVENVASVATVFAVDLLLCSPSFLISSIT